MGHQEQELLSVYRDHGVLPKSSRDDNFNKPSEDLSGYQLVRPGDLVINKMKAWQGSVAISRHAGIVSPAYYVYRPRGDFHGGYLHHLLRSRPYIAQYAAASSGIRPNQWDLEHERLSEIPLLSPPRTVQGLIANFLDRKTAQIDALIGAYERLIALLEEKREAVITQATTKGLDPTVPMKDSGVPWFGRVPAHWDLRAFKRVATIAEGQVDPATPEYQCRILIAPDHIEKGTGRLLKKETANQQAAISGKYLVRPSQIVYSKIRPELNKLCLSHGEWLCSADMYPVSPMAGVDLQWLFYFMLSKPFVASVVSSAPRVAMPKVNRDELGSVPILIPPAAEQKAVAARLKDELFSIDELASKTGLAIDLLKEYRAALITSAVTGEIDVREEGNPDAAEG